jgi:hypothetical protein
VREQADRVLRDGETALAVCGLSALRENLLRTPHGPCPEAHQRRDEPQHAYDQASPVALSPEVEQCEWEACLMLEAQQQYGCPLPVWPMVLNGPRAEGRPARPVRRFE